MDVGGLLGNEAIRARLDAAAAQDRFSHSYLICGPDGSGKHTLAKILAAAMQCTGAGRKPCGRCEGCRKVFEGVHPDIITVNDPAHKTIAVDVIRQMRADVFLRPNEGKRKIYLIEQDMAEPPQNALLKILEEPPAYAAFLILSDRAEKLLPTIRSRCAELHLAPAPQTEGLAFLRGKYPDRAEPELERAFRRAGGYLGQAIQLLSGEGQAPQTAQFAVCYAARNALALLELLLWVAPALHASNTGEAIQNKDFMRVAPILDYIRAHLSEPLKLDQIAGEFFISKHYLCRIFKSATGFSMMEYRETSSRAPWEYSLTASLTSSYSPILSSMGFSLVITWQGPWGSNSLVAFASSHETAPHRPRRSGVTTHTWDGENAWHMIQL